VGDRQPDSPGRRHILEAVSDEIGQLLREHVPYLSDLLSELRVLHRHKWQEISRPL
jgi:hypothetical protein